jgi:alpha-tubulin suppressor-like RCC1 family protein
MPDPPFDSTFALIGFDDVIQLAAGDGFVCGRTTAGTVRCMGRNDEGQLGDGSTNSRAHGEEIEGLSGVVDLGAGRHHACAVVEGGQVFCWGLNRGMQLGIEQGYSPQARPILMPDATGDWQTAKTRVP